MEQLMIKPCTQADLPALSTISRETFWDTFAQYNTRENMEAFLAQAYNQEKLAQELATPNSFFYFLKKGTQTLGYLKLNIADAQSEEIAPDALEIERIYIQKEHLRQGYGKYLLDFAEEKAHGLNKTALWLGVWEHNERAKAFYEKMGFHEVGAHDFYLGDDQQRDLLLLKTF